MPGWQSRERSNRKEMGKERYGKKEKNSLEKSGGSLSAAAPGYDLFYH